MKWILIILIARPEASTPSSLSVEFNSKEACEIAADKTKDEVKVFYEKALIKNRKIPSAIYCVAKGKE